MRGVGGVVAVVPFDSALVVQQRKSQSAFVSVGVTPTMKMLPTS